MADLVAELAGVDIVTAAKALVQHKEVWLAVDSLLVKPAVSGEKYIPEKPVVDSGMPAEQKALCDRGRWLQDQINSVFSVAHSKIRHSQGDPPAAELTDLPLGGDSAVSAPPPSPQLDVPEKTTPEVTQS
jgi:hypothetical protein